MSERQTMMQPAAIPPEPSASIGCTASAHNVPPASEGHSPASLCPSCRERVGAGCRPEARDLSGERQQSRPVRATAGRDGGGPTGE